MILILMGVSGTGKTTIGKLLAAELRWPFYDGDDFHPQANIDKMSRGIALTDKDREAWLATLHQLVERLLQERRSAVIACSALKQAYRTQIQKHNADVQFVYLKGDYALIQRRLQERSGHFMKTDLLTSQFETLEEPDGVLAVDVAHTPQAIVKQIQSCFGLV